MPEISPRRRWPRTPPRCRPDAGVGSSMPIVPWPAITSGSSKGCIEGELAPRSPGLRRGPARRNRNRRAARCHRVAAVGAHGVDLHLRRGHRHDDDRAQAPGAGRRPRPGRGCRLKPRSPRRRCAASRRTILLQRRQRSLEGEHRLHCPALELHRRAGARRQQRGSVAARHIRRAAVRDAAEG